jgi:hypothetical protein
VSRRRDTQLLSVCAPVGSRICRRLSTLKGLPLNGEDRFDDRASCELELSSFAVDLSE